MQGYRGRHIEYGAAQYNRTLRATALAHHGVRRSGSQSGGARPRSASQANAQLK